MSQDDAKRAVATAAVQYVEPGSIVGVGTGSTANCFIDALAGIAGGVEAAVASSVASEERLRGHGIEVVELTRVERIPVYVDGADEATRDGMLIKGGGGALTREKIVAQASDRFVCIVDESKMVERLGAFPLPVEVIPMARGQVARAIQEMGGRPVLRDGFVTDNGNCILDVHGLDLGAPAEFESVLNQVPGVVTNGLFCRRHADVVLVGGAGGVETISCGQ